MINPKEKHQKDLQAMVRELEGLWQQRNHPPVVRLDKPYQRGWIRFLF